jgi:hypothetical protein
MCRQQLSVGSRAQKASMWRAHLTRMCILALAFALACSHQDASRPTGAEDSDADSDAGVPFEALGAEVYGTKVKTVMTGRGLTDDELSALGEDPGALSRLVEAWMEDPAWRARLLGFFQQAFQQTQVSAADYDDQLGLKAGNWRPDVRAHFERAAEESFARTVLALLDEGAPFNEVVRTRRFMLNPPLMALLAYVDAVPQDDAGNPTRRSWLLNKYPTLTLLGDAPAVPLEQMVDPGSPNFFHFQFVPAMPIKAGCERPLSVKGYQALVSMAGVLFGKNPLVCGNGEPLFDEDDWDAWRMVTIRPPKAGEERSVFFDLPKLRAADELVIDSPRVGFMTTPAFFANWPTNDSNQMRVTMNQALIVALGRSFDDSDSTTPVSETTSDAAHSEPGTVCYGCHSQLDPMRDFFRQSFNSYYSQQTEQKKQGIPNVATFHMGESTVTGNGVGDLADALADSELFAEAFTQKLCRLANSSSCAVEDPEFRRIAQDFRDNGYDFKVLVRALFSSPLVTFASATDSAREGVVIGIKRRETLCATLSNRLDLVDVCALHGTVGLRGQMLQRAQVATNLAGAVPGDGYARGSEVPLMPHDPNLFFVAGVDNLCARLATQLVDAAQGTSKWSSSDKEGALDAFVSHLIGIPSIDTRYDALRTVLSEHFDAARAKGAKPSDALRSTFVLACTSPLTVSLGL